MKNFTLSFGLFLLTTLFFIQNSWGQLYLSESFEGTWSGSPAVPSGWSIIHTPASGGGSGTDPIYWAKNTWSGSAWSLTGTGTPENPNGGYDGSSVAWYEDHSAKATQKDQLSTGDINLSTATNPRAIFYLALNASSLTLKLRGSNDGGFSWGDIQTISSPGVSWTKFVVPIPGEYKVSNARFGLEVTASFGSYDIWLDKFVIDEVPPPLVGTKTIDPGGSGGNNYTSFSSAILALNEAGVGTGGVTFNVKDGSAFVENCPIITATGTSGNQIVFQRDNSTSTRPVIKPTFGPGPGEAGIRIEGGDYIIFDGIDITINSGSDVEYGYFICNASATNGAQNNTIKNTKIILNRTNTSSVGIYQYTIITPTNQSTGNNNNNKYYNITIENVYKGIYLSGESSAYYDSGCEIGVTPGGTTTIGSSSANDIGNGSATTAGIHLSNQGGCKVFNADIRNVTVTAGVDVHGIYLENLQNSTCEICYNNIHDIKTLSNSTSSAVYGILANVNSGFSANIYNNFISGLSHAITSASESMVARGIGCHISATTGTVNLYYNSIRMELCGAATNAALYSQSGTVNVVDNILSNFSPTEPTSKRYCFYFSGGTLSKSNNNDFYINTFGTGNNVGYYSSADQNTLGNWQTATSKDFNSKNVNPSFVSAIDLHSSSGDLNGFGVPIKTANGDALDITTDIDHQTRHATTPDIGADEFEGTDTNPPEIFYPQLSNTNSTGSRNLMANILDPSGVPTTAPGWPTLYWKINSGSYTAVSPSTVNGSNYTYNFGSGVVIGDVISYYIVARDLAATPNIGAFPGGGAGDFTYDPPAAGDPPDMPSSYSIVNHHYDFEAPNDQGFTHNFTTGTIDEWQRGTPAGGDGAPGWTFSPSKCWGTNLSGNTGFSVGYALYSPAYKANGTSVNWSFFEFYNTEVDHDYCYPEYKINEGAWTAAITGYSGQITFWSPRSFNITTVVNDMIQFRFRYTADASTSFAGWYIDDMSVMGANEVDMFPPEIFYPQLGNTNSTGSRNLMANIMDPSGVPTTAPGWPTLYWKINSGSYTAVSPSSVAGSNYTYNFGAGVVVGDVVSYFIVARDLAATPNIGAFPGGGAGGFTYDPPAAGDPPDMPSSYSIVNHHYDFEAPNDQGFTHNFTTGTIDEWQRGTPAGGDGAPGWTFSPSKCWGTNLSGNTGFSVGYALYSPAYKANGTSVNWSFFEFYNTEVDHDYCYPEYKINEGAWTAAITGYSGQITFWSPRSFNITTVVDDMIQFRFRYTADASTSFAGWYIDDMSVMGANEVDMFPPFISYPPLGNTNSTSPRNLMANITDPSGVPTTAPGWPTLYWKINSGTYTAVSPSTVNGSNYTYNFGAGVVVGDVVSYYIVARDLAATPNIGAFPGGGAGGFTYDPPAAGDPPDMPSSYSVVNHHYDFEAPNDQGFTHNFTTGSIDEWQRGTPAGGTGAPGWTYSPSKCWGTNLSGNTAMSVGYALYSPSYKANGTSVNWSFFEFYNTEVDHDYCYPEYKINEGAWTAAITGYSGQITFWTPRSFNITTVVNDMIQFRFRYTADASTSFAGWYIDDMSVMGANEVDMFPPFISYPPLGNTNSTSPRNLMANITDPSGVPTTAPGWPTLYWKINSGTYTAVSPSTVNGSNYTYNFGAGVVVGDVVSYYIVARDLAATPNIGAFPGGGAGGFTYDPPAAGTAPSDPSTYMITAAPLSGDYTVGTTLFNKITGSNVTFEKVVKKVMKEVIVEEPVSAVNQEVNIKNKTNAINEKGANPESVTSATVKGRKVIKEVEEVTWLPMENGKVYNGQLYALKSENPDYDFPKGVNGVYATITAAVADLNSRGVSFHTRFLLTDASYTSGETFPIMINVINENMPGPNATVTIKPNTGVTSAITGSTSSALLKVISTNHVAINGSNSQGEGSRDLTITNNSATTPGVVWIGSNGGTPVSMVAVKNCNLINGANTSTAVMISDGFTSGSAGYFNNIEIKNNSIQKAYIGIYAIAAVSMGNGDKLSISQNDLNTSGANSIRLAGVYVQGAAGATVSNNNIGNISNANPETSKGIWCASGTMLSMISENTISTSEYTGGSNYGLTGIYVTTGFSNSYLKISDNIINGITSNGIQNNATSGIYVADGSGGIVIEKNKISNIKNTASGGYSAIGIILGSSLISSNILVINNLMYDIAGYGYASQTTGNGYGINIYSGGGYNIYYNSINLATNQTEAAGVPACLMIDGAVNGANSLDIRNNIFAIPATVGSNRYAVLCNAANTVFLNIDYNDYYNSGPNLGYIGATNRVDLAAWKTGTGKDTNSISADPQFTSSTNLFPQTGSPVIDAGTPISGITTDITGATRSLVTPAIGAYEVVEGALTWTGATDNDWNKSFNWNPDGVPYTITMVTIPNVINDPVIYHDFYNPAQCDNLTIQSGAVLTINPGKALTVNGTFTNNAGVNGLFIKSDVSGTGSLICSTTGIDATVERYLTKMKWHFIGMPVESGFAGVFHLPSGHSDIWLRTHIESTNTWSGDIVPVETPLLQGRGYECWVGDPLGFNQDETVMFPGKLNSGDYTTGSGNFYPLEYTPGHGLNLICNPYPSALEANIHTWTKTNIANSVWTWNPYAGNYVFWNGTTGSMFSGIIPSMQAFFVLATGSGPSLTIPQSNRVHSSEPFYKDSDLPLNTVRLCVTGNGYNDAVFVNFNELASDEYDVNYDVEKIFGLDEAPQIYAQIAGERLSINALPNIGENRTVNIGFECAVPACFTIDVSGMDGFDENIDFYLEDLKEGIVLNLKENPVYTFTGVLGDDPGRFLLHFNNNMAVPEYLTGLAGVKCYAYYHDVYVTSGSPMNGIVIIFDLPGKEMVREKLNGETVKKINLSHHRGFAMVEVICDGSSVTQKVYIY